MIEFLLSPLKIFAADCNSSFFGFPAWHKYLDHNTAGGVCNVELNQLNDIWLIALAIAEILLRIAVVAAIAFVLIGGFKYITSRGNPDKTTSAKNTVIDGLIGLVIAVTATTIISFIARKFTE